MINNWQKKKISFENQKFSVDDQDHIYLMYTEISTQESWRKRSWDSPNDISYHWLYFKKVSFWTVFFDDFSNNFCSWNFQSKEKNLVDF